MYVFYMIGNSTLIVPQQVLSHLSLMMEQRNRINEIYANHQEISLTFDPDNTGHQQQASTLLAEQSLDRHARENLENRWNVQWSNRWKIGKGSDHSYFNGIST